MWQVSGRSDITDFEEVVRLDREYISNWNIGLDICTPMSAEIAARLNFPPMVVENTDNHSTAFTDK